MMSAFGVEHGAISKAMNPTKFARLYPPGIHDVPVRHLTAINRSGPRKAANVRAVADSMASEGQHHPIGVHVFDGKAHIMNGHHRLAAARTIGRKKVKVRVGAGGPYRMGQDPAQHSGWSRPVPHDPRRGKYSSAILDEL